MKFVELVKFDEVFVKLKESENPGHPNDFVSVWVAGQGWSENLLSCSFQIVHRHFFWSDPKKLKMGKNRFWRRG